MNGPAIAALISAGVWAAAKGVAKSKGEVRCNKCGHVGYLKPGNRVGPGTFTQKLVCSQCGEADYTEMKEIQKQIDEKAHEKSMIDQGHICPTCKRAVESGVRFCPYDGTPVSKACSRCGQANAPASAFCAGCGTKL